MQSKSIELKCNHDSTKAVNKKPHNLYRFINTDPDDEEKIVLEIVSVKPDHRKGKLIILHFLEKWVDPCIAMVCVGFKRANENYQFKFDSTGTDFIKMVATIPTNSYRADDEIFIEIKEQKTLESFAKEAVQKK